MATEVLIDITPVPEHDNIKIVKLSGEIDESNLETFKDKIEPLHEDAGTKIIIFHLKDLTFINSKVIGYLASYYTQLTQEEKKMIFTEANPNIMDILSLVGLTNIVEYYETQTEAVNASIVG